MPAVLNWCPFSRSACACRNIPVLKKPPFIVGERVVDFVCDVEGCRRDGGCVIVLVVFGRPRRRRAGGSLVHGSCPGCGRRFASGGLALGLELLLGLLRIMFSDISGLEASKAFGEGVRVKAYGTRGLGRT